MEEKKKPLILISNDDGYDYDGIQALIAIAREMGDVAVVAPQQHQSGMGSAITIARPLRVYKTVDTPGYRVWLVDGTPTDCVKMALDQLLTDRRPDLPGEYIWVPLDRIDDYGHSRLVELLLQSARLALP